jgi:hypothetical protein
MTPGELATACGERMAAGLQIPLVVPRRCTGGRRMRLAGRGSPLGEVACENADGNTVCYFDPVDVLAWLVATVPGVSVQVGAAPTKGEPDGR